MIFFTRPYSRDRWHLKAFKFSRAKRELSRATIGPVRTPLDPIHPGASRQLKKALRAAEGFFFTSDNPALLASRDDHASCGGRVYRAIPGVPAVRATLAVLPSDRADPIRRNILAAVRSGGKIRVGTGGSRDRRRNPLFE